MIGSPIMPPLGAGGSPVDVGRALRLRHRIPFNPVPSIGPPGPGIPPLGPVGVQSGGGQMVPGTPPRPVDHGFGPGGLIPRPVDHGFGPGLHPLGDPNAGGPQRARDFPSRQGNPLLDLIRMRAEAAGRSANGLGHGSLPAAAQAQQRLAALAALAAAGT